MSRYEWVAGPSWMVVALVAVGLGGCAKNNAPASRSGSCTPGKTMECFCPNGQIGSARCGAGGTWEACAGCDGSSQTISPAEVESNESCVPNSLRQCLCPDGITQATQICLSIRFWGDCGSCKPPSVGPACVPNWSSGPWNPCGCDKKQVRTVNDQSRCGIDTGKPSEEQTCNPCGNGKCDCAETNASCAADCAATCGNGKIDPDETSCSCPQDVGKCLGCCSGKECLGGTSLDACGSNGSKCLACGAAQTCAQGSCAAQTPTNTKMCSNDRRFLMEFKNNLWLANDCFDVCRASGTANLVNAVCSSSPSPSCTCESGTVTGKKLGESCDGAQSSPGCGPGLTCVYYDNTNFKGYCLKSCLSDTDCVDGSLKLRCVPMANTLLGHMCVFQCTGNGSTASPIKCLSGDSCLDMAESKKACFPTPSGGSGGGVCTSGQTKCESGKFITCVSGQWNSGTTCGNGCDVQGTACKAYCLLGSQKLSLSTLWCNGGTKYNCVGTPSSTGQIVAPEAYDFCNTGEVCATPDTAGNTSCKTSGGTTVKKKIGEHCSAYSECEVDCYKPQGKQVGHCIAPCTSSNDCTSYTGQKITCMPLSGKTGSFCAYGCDPNFSPAFTCASDDQCITFGLSTGDIKICFPAL